MPPNRPADCRHISSDLDLFGGEQLSVVLTHDHHDEAHIRDPKPWKPEAIAKSKKSGSTPPLQIAASDYTLATRGGQSQAAFQQTWHHRHALCRGCNLFGYSVRWVCCNPLEHLGGIIQTRNRLISS